MKSLFSTLSLLLLIGCSLCDNGKKDIREDMWSNPEAWFDGSMTPDTNKVDVFYLVSTNVVSAKDSAGNLSLCSFLTDEDKEYIDKEMQFAKNRIFHTDFNFVSPYYHQYTFDSFTYYTEKMDSISTIVGNEVCDAFDYYMDKVNNGRRFILAGFSQGGDMVMHILRHMTEEQYSRMVVAYVMGYKVTVSDTLNYSTIRPAKCETDKGVTVSYNSVLSTDGIWDFVTNGTVACINPMNWRTDTTSVSFTYDGRLHKSHIDRQRNVIIVDTDPTPYNKWMRENPPYSTSSINDDCLHHWDILFYASQIHDNAVKRCN